MRRFLPNSLVGQVAFLLAAALLVAQAVNFTLLLSEGQRARLAQAENPAIARLVGAADTLASTAPAERRRLLRALSGGGARFTATARPLVERRAIARDAALEERVSVALREAEVTTGEVQAGEGLPRRRAAMPARGEAPRGRLLLVSVQLPDGDWLNARFAVRARDAGFVTRLLLATLALYGIVLGAALLIARRLSRPLQAVTAAAETFHGREPGVPLEPRGPADLKRLAEAFNAMRARLVELLSEKDRMIGAIGHDLRTPLASLRIRAESVPDEAERERMIATIESLDLTLDDILALARAGQPAEPLRPVDLAALVEALVEEFRDTGRAVAFAGPDRLVATVRANAIRRAVRNLIDNALTYGGTAGVTVSPADGAAHIRIDDDGPGIPASEVDRVTDPFYRLEASRNRATGGSGLGLAIARTVAEAHGGRLELSNRQEGGLVAALIVPV